MIAFLTTGILYVSVLLLYRPPPVSLHARAYNITEHAARIKASLLCGIMLLFIFYLTSDGSFIVITDEAFILFGLGASSDSQPYWPMQMVTHLLVHVNALHVVSNVLIIGVASAYERRVGSRRYMAVLFIGAIASVPSYMFHVDDVISCGISGGVTALIAAYVTDHRNMCMRQWCKALAVCAAIGMLIWGIEDGGEQALVIDHYAHVMGALAGVIYCRIVQPNVGTSYRHYPQVSLE